jgi:cation:H+ antiporter
MLGIVGIFIIGIGFLLVSTDIFIKSSIRLSVSARVSPLVIGLTVVSIGTSLPELVVSTISAIKGDMGLAMGNIIGSNIINVLLVFAVGILAGKLRVGSTKTQRNVYVLFGLTILFLLLYALQIPNGISGVILLSCTLLISYYEYSLGVGGRKKEDRESYKTLSKTPFILNDMLILIGTLLGIVFGGILTVYSVERLSAILGFSTTVLGLSVTAIATSLPELMTTIFSQRNHEEKLTIGNIIGSNIYNLALIGGIVLLFSPWKTITHYEYLMLIGVTVLFVTIIVLNKGKEISKYIGIGLLSLFAVYIYYLR